MMGRDRLKRWALVLGGAAVLVVAFGAGVIIAANVGVVYSIPRIAN
jgi:hypothetical protein